MGRKKTEFTRDDVRAFGEAMLRRKYTQSHVSQSKQVINGFHADYKCDLTNANITKYDFDVATVYRNVNTMLILTMFREWLVKRDDNVIWGARVKGQRDGLSRPVSCRKTDCVYNSGGRCRYKPLKELNHPIAWSGCSYYEKKEDDDVPVKIRLCYDHIYKRRASYQDASSVRWI